MVKLLSCDLVVTGSSRVNSLLQCRVKMRTIKPNVIRLFFGFRIGESFVH